MTDQDREVEGIEDALALVGRQPAATHDPGRDTGPAHRAGQGPSHGANHGSGRSGEAGPYDHATDSGDTGPYDHATDQDQDRGHGSTNPARDGRASEAAGTESPVLPASGRVLGRGPRARGAVGAVGSGRPRPPGPSRPGSRSGTRRAADRAHRSAVLRHIGHGRLGGLRAGPVVRTDREGHETEHREGTERERHGTRRERETTRRERNTTRRDGRSRGSRRQRHPRRTRGHRAAPRRRGGTDRHRRPDPVRRDRRDPRRARPYGRQRPSPRRARGDPGAGHPAARPGVPLRRPAPARGLPGDPGRAGSRGGGRVRRVAHRPAPERRGPGPR